MASVNGTGDSPLKYGQLQTLPPFYTPSHLPFHSSSVTLYTRVPLVL